MTQSIKAIKPATSLKLSARCLEEWQQVILKYAKIKGLAPELSSHDKIKALLKQEFKNIEQLWEAFTVDRSNLPRYLLDPKKQTVAYLLGFHLPNVARSLALLERVQKRIFLAKALNEMSHIRVHDWGCGTGAMSQAWMEYMTRHQVQKEKLSSWEILDQHGAFLDATRELLQPHLSPGALKSRRGRLEDLLSEEHKTQEVSQHGVDLILMGYVWNELASNPKAQRRTMEALHDYLDQNSLIMVLEPANQYPARSAMEFRDTLVEMGWKILYPCPGLSSCPMLKLNRDWCYSEFAWSPPPLMKWLDERMSINHSRLNGAGYLFISPKFAEKLKFDSWVEPIVGRPVEKREGPAPKGSRSNRFSYLVCRDQKLDKVAAKPQVFISRGLPVPNPPKTEEDSKPTLNLTAQRRKKPLGKSNGKKL